MSIEPPVIYISSHKSHYTNIGISENGYFSVNIPSVDLVKKIDYCGLVSGHKTNKSDPVPYDDELLYSIKARFNIYSGNNNITETVNELFKKRKVTAIYDLPCNLSDLVNNMPSSWKYSVEKLINDYTLYPYYRPFWGKKRANDICNLMHENTDQRIHIIAGIHSSKIEQCKYLKFCKKCVGEELIQYGEAYWHRLFQVPGVLVCPIHKEVLQNSKIRTYELNCQYYYAATIDNCNDNLNGLIYNTFVFEKLVRLANDIKWIMEKNLPSNEPEDLRKRYLFILQEQGLVTRKGRVDQNRILERFINYYGEEFLSALSVLPDINNEHNWVSLIFRKYDIDPQPLKHILIIIFLTDSIQKFFSTEYESKPFGDGPYPCLNAAANHFRKPVIADVVVEYSRNRNVLGTFSCSCGFRYARLGPDKEDSDRFKYTTIKEYGEVWKNKLCELIEVRSLHLREVARELRVDLKTIRKYVDKYNLNTNYKYAEFEAKTISNSEDNIQQNFNYENLRRAYRLKWKTLLQNNPGINKTKLKEIDKQTFYWLNYHDKEWLIQNSPYVKINNRSFSKVDWETRDLQIKCNIESLIKSFEAKDERPKWISKDMIGKTLGMQYLLRNNLEKLPLTREYINKVCESRDEYKIKRIKWAITRLKAIDGELKIWKIKQLAGVLSRQSQYIDDAISSELKKIQTSGEI